MFPLVTSECLIRSVFCFLILVFGFGPVLSQSTTELKERRDRLLTEIKENTRRLGDTRRNKEATLGQLALLQQQISKREELIRTLQKEISRTDASISRTTEVVSALNQDVGRLKEEYGHLLRAAYRARLQNNWLTFLLSSNSFNEAFRRWQYLRQYQRFRSRQARLIVATQKTMETKLEQLGKGKKEKEALLSTEKNQQIAIGREKSAQDILLRKIKKSESNILAEIKKQEIAREELNQAIEGAIASEMARIREEERASRNSSSTNVSNKNKTSISAVTGGNFASKKGRLPWPVDGDITKRFGRQAHPTVKGVEISNNGIDISVANNSDVKVVAEGTVVSTHFVPGYRNMILVRHGDYYTVYSNLETVSVASGSTLAAGQTIGRISKQAGELHFEVWRQKERLNPERWIGKS